MLCRSWSALPKRNKTKISWPSLGVMQVDDFRLCRRMGDSYKEWKNLFPFILSGNNCVESLQVVLPQKGGRGINSWTIKKSQMARCKATWLEYSDSW